MKIQSALRCVFVLFLGLCAGSVLAADAKAPPRGNVAELWMVWVTPGHEAQFEAAHKAHIAWRKQSGEAFAWQIFQPIVGNDLTYFVYRTDGHEWADVDKNRAWESKTKASEEYLKNVGPHVARYEHYFSEDDVKRSYWTESDDYRYFGVARLPVKTGMGSDMRAALDKVTKAAVDQKWTRSWSVADMIGGDGGMSVVYPYRTYAEMADPDPSFMSILAKSLGSEEEAKATMKQLGSSFDRGTYTIYEHRRDLSTPK